MWTTPVFPTLAGTCVRSKLVDPALFPLSPPRGQKPPQAPVCGQGRGCAKTIPNLAHRSGHPSFFEQEEPPALDGKALTAINKVAKSAPGRAGIPCCTAHMPISTHAERPHRRVPAGNRPVRTSRRGNQPPPIHASPERRRADCPLRSHRPGGSWLFFGSYMNQ